MSCSGMEINTHQHGGVPQSTFERLGVEPGPVIDFSVNISPLGVPDCLLKTWDDMPALLTSYPEIMGNGVHTFYENRFNLPSDAVLAGNGSIELIYLIPRALGWKKVLVPQPSFFEYRRACELAGCEIDLGQLEDFSDHDAIYIGSPNNPTGTTIPASTLLELADANPNRWIVVDQAFIDFCEHQEQITLLHPDRLRKNLIVLHSLTKFYALPGLRIGAAVSHPETTARLAEFKEPWTINAIAQKACELMAYDSSYDDKLHALITIERKRMREALARMPQFEIQPGGKANFLLLHWKGDRNLDELLKHLLERGLFVRDCRNFPNLPDHCFRIAIRTAEENDRLLEALKYA
ncbi:threonine-phosphate decarboxylase CobD [Verrucomicrobiota bacterium]